MKSEQLPHGLLMVRPASFGFNPETSSSNAFQSAGDGTSDVNAVVRKEFDQMIDMLQAHDIDVVVYEDSIDVVRPDAVFPNNWITLHADGRIILYPIMAANRRSERRPDIVRDLQNKYFVNEVVDLSAAENEGRFLEGTGSMVFDHGNNIIYACRSPRTNQTVLSAVAKILNYKTIVFDATDEKDVPIYHTNVMMSVAKEFAVLCLDAVRNEDDQDKLLDSFERTSHKVIAISYSQMNAFAGNMFSVKNRHGESFVLMSQTAFDSLLPGQINEISKYSEVLPFHVANIERYGGGSVRCMVAGIHLKKNDHRSSLNDG
jgi:hypothetical protein